MYKPLKEAAALLAAQGKNLDSPISGTAQLEPGRLYDVRIVSVDLSPLHQAGRVSLDLESPTGGSLETAIWPMDKYQSNRFGRQFMDWLNALFLNQDALPQFAAAATVLGDTVFNCFRGLTLRVQVGWSPGFITQVGADSKISVVDSQSGNRLTETVFDSVNEARDAARRNGAKRAWPRVTSFSPVSPEVCDGNWDAFNRAVAGLTEIQRSSIPAAQTTPGT